MYRNTPPALPCLPVSPLCLFGIGHLLEDSLQGVITALGRTPDFLCDNAPHKWGKTFWGIPCISPDELARKAPDIAVVITNDSDLLAPIRIVREELGKTVGILNPQKHPSRALLPHIDFIKQIRSGGLAASQFAQRLTDVNGAFTKPSDW